MFDLPFSARRNTVFITVLVLFFAFVFLPGEIPAAEDTAPQSVAFLEQAAKTCLDQKDYAGSGKIPTNPSGLSRCDGVPVRADKGIASAGGRYNGSGGGGHASFRLRNPSGHRQSG